MTLGPLAERLKTPRLTTAPATTNTAPTPQAQTSWQQIGDVATIEVRESRTIRTLEDLLKAANVDQELWEVATRTINKWDSTVRNGDGNATVQLWQVCCQPEAPERGGRPLKAPGQHHRHHRRLRADRAPTVGQRAFADVQPHRRTPGQAGLRRRVG